MSPLMRFRASDSYDYFRPSPCGLRVFLRSRGEPEAEPGAFDLLLRRLGLQHERRHLGTLPDVVDLSGLPPEERERRTRLEIQAGAPALYQPRFGTQIVLDGTLCELIGEPDFLIREGRGYVVRDAKLARRVSGGRHLKIALQLQLYGWLFERATGSPPVRLEVYSGAGQLVAIPQDPGAALGLLRWLKDLRLRTEEFYEPVGWSKCGGCAFHERCWSRAVGSHDPAILPTVNQELARELHRRGVRTLDQL
ncbi:MAG TPA: PD-(D/E)XK nuclease family protein, partial [Thermoanaerobaculia bacterium]|nr:PD-(D/E)XK nuclease family protein [Thermoanaerobaculia bacterium]